jgi:hypothetical protein
MGVAECLQNNSKGNKMLEAIFWILIGAFVGWHFPQPEWAKALETKVRSLFANRE